MADSKVTTMLPAMTIGRILKLASRASVKVNPANPGAMPMPASKTNHCTPGAQDRGFGSEKPIEQAADAPRLHNGEVASASNHPAH